MLHTSIYKDDTWESQNKVTLQILNMCPPCKDLNQTFTFSRRVEQFRLCVQHLVVPTSEDWVLLTEMVSLESQEEDVPRRVL
jgi:hypothetical protein